MLRLSQPNRRSQQRILGKVADAALSTTSDGADRVRAGREVGREGAKKAGREKREREAVWCGVWSRCLEA